MLLFTLVAMALADRVGRRPLLLISSVGMAAGLFALGAAYAGSDQESAWSLLLWVLVYVASFSIGMGPLVWTVLGEIFPNRVRAHAASACVFLLWTANFAVSQLFPWMLSTFEYRVFWLFGALCVLTIAFVWFLVPETKGRSLEELESFSR
jgi:MFS family permease